VLLHYLAQTEAFYAVSAPHRAASASVSGKSTVFNILGACSVAEGNKSTPLCYTDAVVMFGASGLRGGAIAADKVAFSSSNCRVITHSYVESNLDCLY